MRILSTLAVVAGFLLLMVTAGGAGPLVEAAARGDVAATVYTAVAMLLANTITGVAAGRAQRAG